MLYVCQLDVLAWLYCSAINEQILDLSTFQSIFVSWLFSFICIVWYAHNSICYVFLVNCPFYHYIWSIFVYCHLFLAYSLFWYEYDCAHWLLTATGLERLLSSLQFKPMFFFRVEVNVLEAAYRCVFSFIQQLCVFQLVDLTHL